MGAAAVGPQGVMQADIILVAAERRFINKAEKVVLLVDSSKFHSSSGAIVCGLDEIDVLVTDPGISDSMRSALTKAGVELIIAAE
jgi:DeoR family ulaG and ulaABCDEF operon transcriptional repressor